jgi:hypothetical protein
MLSDKVFQSILPLNDSEICPYDDVLIFGSWRRFLILRIYLTSLVMKNSDKIEGLMAFVDSYILTISFCRFLQWIIISYYLANSPSNVDV